MLYSFPVASSAPKLSCTHTILQRALSPVEVSELLALDSIRNKPYHISASNALTGQGLNEGIDWLADQVRLLVK